VGGWVGGWVYVNVYVLSCMIHRQQTIQLKSMSIHICVYSDIYTYQCIRSHLFLNTYMVTYIEYVNTDVCMYIYKCTVHSTSFLIFLGAGTCGIQIVDRF